jgi:DNA-binding Lrp family transcriptional regulator
MVQHRHINHNDMRNRNLALILNYLHQNGPISRTDLSLQTGINKASISTTVRELINRGIVIETGVKGGVREVGHPSINLIVNPDAGRVIGVEVEPDCVSAVISDIALHFLWRRQVEINNLQDSQSVFAVVREVTHQACTEARSYGLPILGLGLGVPGLVDIDANILLLAPELGWRDVDLNPLMADCPDIRFFTGNEAHMSALGDCYFGTSRESV